MSLAGRRVVHYRIGMNLSRRHFLRTGAGAAVAFTALRNWSLRAAPIPTAAGLVADPAGILDLPPGFSYRILSRTGDEMADGLLVPGLPDGMGAFPGAAGRVLLLRNHEIAEQGADIGAFGKKYERLAKVEPAFLYDAGHRRTPGLGGVTTLVYDPAAGKVEAQFLALAGTIRNCAGGQTPWGSWVTCEETTVRANGDLEKDHGYAFEVPARARPYRVRPEPLRAMGRFNREAIAVEARSGCVYQTEDRPDGLLYRYRPDHPGELARGGRLEALALRDRPSADLRNWEPPTVNRGTPLEVRWIPVGNPESPLDDLRHANFDKGAARFARAEGIFATPRGIFFCCTNGGPALLGQIWHYQPAPNEGAMNESGAKLELYLEPNDAALLRNGDNMTAAPDGSLVVCEDAVDRSAGPTPERLIWITPAGQPRVLAQTARNSEWAGATFAPDGSTLFVNLQNEGLTLAIRGDWSAMSRA